MEVSLTNGKNSDRIGLHSGHRNLHALPKKPSRSGLVPFENLEWPLPAEWQEKHCVWLGWRENPALFGFTKALNLFHTLRLHFFHFLMQLSEDVPIRLAISKKDLSIVLKILGKNKTIDKKDKKKLLGENIEIAFLNLDDVWLRDSGPFFFNSKTALSCRFNGWGEKYEHRADVQLSKKIAEIQLSDSDRIFSSDFICEGGAIESNGYDTLLATESVFSSPNRNGLNSRETVVILQKLFGLKNVVLLTGGLEGDDTDGHVDNVARFVDRRCVFALIAEDGAVDKEALQLAENLKRLKYCLKETKIVTLLRLPLAWRIQKNSKKILPMSHLNFFISKTKVFVPTFFSSSKPSKAKQNLNRDKQLAILHEKATLKKISKHFPKHSITAIDWQLGIHGGGGVHCLTQPVYR